MPVAFSSDNIKILYFKIMNSEEVRLNSLYNASKWFLCILLEVFFINLYHLQ